MRPSPLKRDVYPTIVKTTNAVTFDTTDAQIVRPYNGYTSPLIALTSNLYSSPRQKIGKLSSPEIVHSWGANPNSNETRKK